MTHSAASEYLGVLLPCVIGNEARDQVAVTGEEESLKLVGVFVVGFVWWSFCGGLFCCRCFCGRCFCDGVFVVGVFVVVFLLSV